MHVVSTVLFNWASIFGNSLIIKGTSVLCSSMRDIETSLVFVYNADSGTFNTLKDILTRIVTPNNYSCRLCGLTYGAIGMKSKWRQFLDSGFFV